MGLSSAGEFGESHPLEVTIHAGPLSLPVEVWSKSDRQSAKRLMGWAPQVSLDDGLRQTIEFVEIGRAHV